jgi:hypothetical protein
MRKLFYSLLVMSVCCGVSYADFFYLKSGKVINGKIVAEADDSITVSVSGTGVKRKIMLYEIEEITKTPKAVPVAAPKTEIAASAEEAKTHFTSDLKQGTAEGETYIKDNRSGVLIFNVQETVVEKPKTQEAAKPAPSSDEEFDAALFLLGNSAANSTPPAPKTVSAPAPAAAVSQPVTVQKEEKPKKEKKAKPSKETKAETPKQDEEFDAALFLLSSEEPAEDPLAKKEKEVQQTKNDDYYDPAMFLLEDQSMTQTSSQPKESSPSKKKDQKQPALKTTADNKPAKAVSAKPDSETFLAVALDLKGVNIFSGEVKESGVKSSADLTENSDYGVSLSAEQYGYLSRFAAVGAGIGFQFKRCLEDSPGRFGFLPLYAAFKMRFVSEEDYHFYAVAHLGYNFLLANSDYLGKSETDGGLYYAGGLGASYNKYVFQVLYSVNNASVNYSNSFAGNKVDKDVMYSKVGLYIGYLL